MFQLNVHLFERHLLVSLLKAPQVRVKTAMAREGLR